MIELTAIVASLSLVLAAPPVASDSDAYSVIDPAGGDGQLTASQQQDANGSGPSSLEDNELAVVMGTGDGTDFICGAMSGASLALVLSGVGGPAGVVLGIGGVACSMFF